MKNFALTGIAGYIAPRHLKAIKETNNNLIAAIDPHDSVGILDQYFPETSFFTEFERFDRHLEKLRRENPDDKLVVSRERDRPLREMSNIWIINSLLLGKGTDRFGKRRTSGS